MTIQMDRLSYSRLNTYETCGRAFFKRYVEHSDPENLTDEYFAEYGTLIHALYEVHSEAKGIIPKTVLADMFHNGTDNRGGDVKGFNSIDFPLFRGKPYMRDKYYDQGLATVERIANSNVSNVIGSEVEFNIKIRDDIAPINGFIDRIIRDENGITIVDFKSSKPYSQDFCDTSLQMSIYSMACLELYGELPYQLKYEFFRFDEHVITHRTIEQLEQAKQYIIGIWDKIQSGEFNPTYDSWYCSHFCAYRMSCDHYQIEKAKEEAAKANKKKRGAKK